MPDGATGMTFWLAKSVSHAVGAEVRFASPDFCCVVMGYFWSRIVAEEWRNRHPKGTE
jgi:hypothetical protein